MVPVPVEHRRTDPRSNQCERGRPGTAPFASGVLELHGGYSRNCGRLLERVRALSLISVGKQRHHAGEEEHVRKAGRDNHVYQQLNMATSNRRSSFPPGEATHT